MVNDQCDVNLIGHHLHTEKRLILFCVFCILSDVTNFFKLVNSILVIPLKLTIIY